MRSFLVGGGDGHPAWCQGEPVMDEQGGIPLDVINGYYKARLVNGNILFEGTAIIRGVRVLWQGDAPFAPQEYNRAIAWIKEQIGEEA